MILYYDLLVLAGIVLVLYIFWTVVWVPTMKCHYRDKLHRLGVRTAEFFGDDCKGQKEKCDHYCRSLSRMLAAYSRNISKASFSSLLSFRYAVKKNPALSDHFQMFGAEIEAGFSTEDEEKKQFITQIREEASRALSCFMFYRNPVYVMLLAPLCIPAFLMYLLAKTLDIVSNLKISKYFNFKMIERFVCSLATR